VHKLCWRSHIAAIAGRLRTLGARWYLAARPHPNRPLSALLRAILHDDRRDVVNETATGLVARCHDLGRRFGAERLPVVFIGDQDLIAAEAGIDLAGAEDRDLSVSASDDDDLVKNVVLDGRVGDDAASRLADPTAVRR
jgi:hypothetical protein